MKYKLKNSSSFGYFRNSLLKDLWGIVLLKISLWCLCKLCIYTMVTS